NSKRRPDRPLHTTKIKTQKVLENPIFIGISSTFITSNCQSWEYTTAVFLRQHTFLPACPFSGQNNLL
ncbi:MAG: hypothetical protein LKG95_08410, partial [Solobacterium sp.]|nr:hypothetical protein [Solobacterium sp.]MCI1418430.1 hypothetical protein [Solobacterium sp.]MCI1434570.1 hypothetical protein [Solobacterium sp.]MCI1559341.1 hypothetical protein [Solobacterium sp.]